MNDHSELKKSAEAAIEAGIESGERWPQDDDWFEPELISAELDYVKKATPTAVLALIAEVEGLRAQHGRDSAELRSLSQARDDARKERDQLKAQVEQQAEEYDKAWRHDLNDKNNFQVLAAEVKRITAMNHSQFGAAIRSSAERDQLKAEVERQAAEIVELKDGNRGLQWAIGEMKGQHKNLHRSLCARFGYVHDEKDWWRDEVSLEEHIAAQIGQLKAEVEALRKDAERYRWLRSGSDYEVALHEGPELDKVIDCAMGEAAKP